MWELLGEGVQPFDVPHVFLAGDEDSSPRFDDGNFASLDAVVEAAA